MGQMFGMGYHLPAFQGWEWKTVQSDDSSLEISVPEAGRQTAELMIWECFKFTVKDSCGNHHVGEFFETLELGTCNNLTTAWLK